MPISESLPQEQAVNKKPNCYKCKHRGSVPGSAHSSCKHPSIKVDPFAMLVGTFGKRSGATSIEEGTESAIRVTGNPYGTSKGWFLWPANFDPVWLETCDGFEEKSEVTE